MIKLTASAEFIEDILTPGVGHRLGTELTQGLPKGVTLEAIALSEDKKTIEFLFDDDKEEVEIVKIRIESSQDVMEYLHGRVA